MAGAASVMRRHLRRNGGKGNRTPASKRYTSRSDANTRIGMNGSGTFSNIPGYATVSRPTVTRTIA